MLQAIADEFFPDVEQPMASGALCDFGQSEGIALKRGARQLRRQTATPAGFA